MWMIDDPEQAAVGWKLLHWHSAPAGATTVLLPIYLSFPRRTGQPFITIWLTFSLHAGDRVFDGLASAGISGKRVGKRVPPEMVLPVFVMVVLFFAMLVSYLWQVLTVGTLA